MQIRPETYFDALTTQESIADLRVRLLQIVLVVLIIAGITFTASNLIAGGSFLTITGMIPPLSTVIAIVFLLLVQRRLLLLPISVIVTSYFAGISIFLFILTDDLFILLLPLSITLLLNALLTNRVFYLFGNIASLLTILVATFISTYSVDSTLLDNIIGISVLLSFGIIPLAIGFIARYFITTLQQTNYETQRSLSLLATSAEIGLIVADMLDLNELLERVAEIVRDRFAFYHVSMFLLDDNQQYAVLTASTGDIGEQMLARGHRLSVNSDSVVGRSTQAKETIIARDTDSEGRRSFNELLPFTRSELAVPIIDNDGIVGVVDIQSQRPDAFTIAEIEALQVIANQLATAIRNARLFEDKERNIRENKRLFIEAETNLREIQRLNRQLTKQAWSDYLRTTRRVDGVTLSDNSFNNSAEWSSEMLEASERRRAITEEKDGKRMVAVPIELRGEVVGAIELETDKNRQEDDLVDMVRAVTQRLAVSLDNARLFEESNEATAQEQRVGEIVSQYPSADSVNQLLRITLEGLAETLGAEHASVRLGVIPDLTKTEDTTLSKAYVPADVSDNGDTHVD